MRVRYTHDCTRTIRNAVVCARHQPNEGRKVHSYCINSSLSFLSRAHLNQQKASCHPAPVRALSGRALSMRSLSVPRPSLHLASSIRARRSSILGAKSSPLWRAPKSRPLVFAQLLSPRSIREKGWCTPPPLVSKRVPFVPYGGLATNDSCYSFATQFSLRSAVPPSLSPASHPLVCTRLAALCSSGMFVQARFDFHR